MWNLGPSNLAVFYSPFYPHLIPFNADSTHDTAAAADANATQNAVDAANGTLGAPAAHTGGTTGTTTAEGIRGDDTGSFGYDDALVAAARNAQQRSAANANAAGTTEATTAEVNRSDVADNAQQSAATANTAGTPEAASAAGDDNSDPPDEGGETTPDEENTDTPPDDDNNVTPPITDEDAKAAAEEAFNGKGYADEFQNAYVDAYQEALKKGMTAEEADAAAYAALTEQILRDDPAADQAGSLGQNMDNEVFKREYIKARLSGYNVNLACSLADARTRNQTSKFYMEVSRLLERNNYTDEQKDLYTKTYIELREAGEEPTNARLKADFFMRRGYLP